MTYEEELNRILSEFRDIWLTIPRPVRLAIVIASRFRRAINTQSEGKRENKMIEIKASKFYRFESRASVERMAKAHTDPDIEQALTDWLRENPELKTVRELGLEVNIKPVSGVYEATVTYKDVSYCGRAVRPEIALTKLLDMEVGS